MRVVVITSMAAVIVIVVAHDDPGIIPLRKDRGRCR